MAGARVAAAFVSEKQARSPDLTSCMTNRDGSNHPPSRRGGGGGAAGVGLVES